MDLTCSEPPGHATHWTGRAMAKAVGVSPRAVQRLWQAHRLQPHRIRTFKRSNDPEFAEKVGDIVGLYMDPPEHTVVVSIDEKGQIQALDRTQPGRCDYRTAKRQTLPHTNQKIFDPHYGAKGTFDRRWKQHYIAGTNRVGHHSPYHHDWEKERVPVSGFDCTKSRSLEEFSLTLRPSSGAPGGRQRRVLTSSSCMLGD
jgi:hypothetical protein